MKNFKKIFLLFGLIMCICIAFSACSAVPDDADGAAGTPQEQVSEAMLMYREAVEAGYTGDYLEFLEEYLKPAEPPASGNTNIVVTEEGDNTGADLAALSVVKIQSTFAVRSFNPQIPAFVTAWGAGVIYSIDEDSGDAYIITNYHVVYESSSLGTETVAHVSDEISIWLFGGELDDGKLSATFVGGAIDYDVAVLFIDGDATVRQSNGRVHTNASVLQNSAARPVTIADSDDISIGDKVFAIGNPNGEGISATQGIVSVEAEYLTTTALNSYTRTVSFLEIRIDAAVNHGNSGGGLFNARGEYIGTVNARKEDSGLRDFGYALPSNLTIAIARNVLSVRNTGARRANLGITAEILSSRGVYDEQTGKADTVQSIGVASVTSGGAADGYLQAGDVILAVSYGGERKQIVREYQLTFLAFNLRAGDTAVFEILRDGEPMTVAIEFTYNNFETIY